MGGIVMMPRRHLMASVGIGLFGWWWSGAAVTLPASVVAGTLADLDHGADYGWYALKGEHRLVVPLHSYELTVPLWWGATRLLGKRAATIILASYLLHLLSDQVENRAEPGAYSLFWRIARGFSFEKLSRDPVAAIQGREDDLYRLRQLISQVRIPW